MHTGQPASQLRSSQRIRVLLPIGSCEQHGPHLPVDTDLRIAQLLADALAHQFSDEQTYVLPALPFSCSWEHKGAGMIALSTTTLAMLLHDIARSLLTWHTPLVLILVNWHGGNTALGSIATEISMQYELPTFALTPLSLAQRLWQATYGSLSQDVHGRHGRNSDYASLLAHTSAVYRPTRRSFVRVNRFSANVFAGSWLPRRFIQWRLGPSTGSKC
jgi:creatinine amidohydrolase/Fe(II)-dependent formamide hydrolase-like protein